MVRYLYIFSEEEIAEQTEKEFQRVRMNIEIPGFRRGKAPLNLIKGAINREEITGRLLEHFARQVGEDIEKNVEGLIDFSFEKEVTNEETTKKFPVIVYKKPVVRLPDYASIEVKKPIPSEEMIRIWRDESIKTLQREHAAMEPKDTPAEYGDKVLYVYQVNNEEGRQLYASNEETLLLDKENLSPIVEQLVGKKSGETFTFERTFDAKKEGEEKHRFIYEVQVKEVYRLIPPEVDDALAYEVSEEYNTLEELTSALDKANIAYFEAVALRNSREQLKHSLTDKSEVDLSAETIEMYTEKHIEEQKKEGKFDKSVSEHASEEVYREHLKEQIRSMLKLSWVIKQASEKHQIEVTDEKMQNLIRSQPNAFENNPEKYIAKLKSDAEFRYQLKSQLLEEEVLDYILTQVTTINEEFSTTDADKNNGQEIEPGSEASENIEKE
jgi:trigger factor